MHEHTLTWHTGTAQAVLAVSGDLGGSPAADHAFATALDGLADMCDAHSPATAVIDMTGAGFVESSALNALIHTHRRTGQSLRVLLTADQTFIRRVIAITGLDRMLVVETASGTETRAED